MKIYITLKQLTCRRATVVPISYEIDGEPKTVCQLLTAVVRREVALYNERAEAGEVLRCLTQKEVDDKAAGGKVGFGAHYNNKVADVQRAIDNALQCYEDGIFRVFVDDVETGALDDQVSIKEGSTLAFVRLTMLAGRMW